MRVRLIKTINCLFRSPGESNNPPEFNEHVMIFAILPKDGFEIPDGIFVAFAQARDHPKNMICPDT